MKYPELETETETDPVTDAPTDTATEAPTETATEAPSTLLESVPSSESESTSGGCSSVVLPSALVAPTGLCCGAVLTPQTPQTGLIPLCRQRYAGGLLKESPDPPRTFLDLFYCFPETALVFASGLFTLPLLPETPRRGAWFRYPVPVPAGEGLPSAALAIPCPGERTISNAAVACDG